MSEKHRNGDTCPVCRGTNQIWQHQDAHRSEGWIPCTFSTGRPCRWGTCVDLQCVKGKLTRDYTVSEPERSALNAIDRGERPRVRVKAGSRRVAC